MKTLPRFRSFIASFSSSICSSLKLYSTHALPILHSPHSFTSLTVSISRALLSLSLTHAPSLYLSLDRTPHSPALAPLTPLHSHPLFYCTRTPHSPALVPFILMHSHPSFFCTHTPHSPALLNSCTCTPHSAALIHSLSHSPTQSCSLCRSDSEVNVHVSSSCFTNTVEETPL